MKKRVFKIAMSVVVLAVIAGVWLQNRKEETKLSDLAMANIEALAAEEIQKKCPDTYDVYDHQLSFSQRTANCTVGVDGEISIMGKKFKIA